MEMLCYRILIQKIHRVSLIMQLILYKFFLFFIIMQLLLFFFSFSSYSLFLFWIVKFYESDYDAGPSSISIYVYNEDNGLTFKAGVRFPFFPNIASYSKSYAIIFRIWTLILS